MLKLCIDIDGVIADSNELFLDIIPDFTNGRVNLKREDLTQWEHCKCTDANGQHITEEEFEGIHEIFSKRAMEINPIPGAVEAIDRLSNDFEIHYVTGRQHTTFQTTWNWLSKHGFPLVSGQYQDSTIRGTTTGKNHTLFYAPRLLKQHYAKGCVAAIEDDPLQAQLFIDSGIKTALFKQHYDTGDIISFSTWEEIEEWINFGQVTTG